MEETFDLDEHDIKPDLTARYILDQVDEFLIYQHYLGVCKPGKLNKHPFRKEKHASFGIFIGPTDGRLMWKDFSNGEAGDCFKLVSKLKYLTYFEAINQIACDFGLLKGCTPIYTKKQVLDARESKEIFRQECEIIIEPRRMNQAELDYWAQYGITKEELKSNHIYAIKKMWINKQQSFIGGGLKFAYHFPSVGKWKVYTPDREPRFFGNISALQMEGIEDLVPSLDKPLIIGKSRKDMIVLKKVFTNVCSTQNEAESAVPKEMDIKLNEMYPLGVFILWDNDPPGVTACKKLNSRGYKYLNIPKKYECKDPADLVMKFGLEEAGKILKQEITKKLTTCV